MFTVPQVSVLVSTIFTYVTVQLTFYRSDKVFNSLYTFPRETPQVTLFLEHSSYAKYDLFFISTWLYVYHIFFFFHFDR